MSVPKIIMTDNGSANVSRLQRQKLTPAQRDELAHLAAYLRISLQQAYLGLRVGSISLSGQ